MQVFWAAMASVCLWLLAIGSSQAADLEQLLKDGRVPGLAFAVIRDGRIVETGALGVRDASTGLPVDGDTIFEAASLSKPVFTYAVLQLVEAGLLSLDTPLSRDVPGYVTDDPRAASITVRNVLSQSSGLPNWRSNTEPLKTYFPPGERFSYSGEGFVWLQRVVEKITGQSLDKVMTRLVFDPLEMRRSSYLWRPDFETDYASPHDAHAVPGDKQRPAKAKSASTLHTTAACRRSCPARASIPRRRNNGSNRRSGCDSAAFNVSRPTSRIRTSTSRGGWAGASNPMPAHSSIGVTTTGSRRL